MYAGKVTLPGSKLGTQARKVNFRKRLLGASEIATRSIKDRSRTDKIVARLMMKSDRQLNQSLEMPAPGASTSQRPPNIFKHFMGVEKMGAVKEPDALRETNTVCDRFCHQFKSDTGPVFLEKYSFPYNSRCQ
jgi:hypothetical protein